MKDLRYQINSDVGKRESKLSNELNLLSENYEIGKQLHQYQDDY